MIVKSQKWLPMTYVINEVGNFFLTLHIFKGEKVKDDNITFYKLGLNGHAKKGFNYIIHVQRIPKFL
jgi:hypothetical protein